MRSGMSYIARRTSAYLLRNSGMTSKPIVAIVGRPNVGKSTLFNRILGVRQAIVMDEPGVTRDRHYALGDWAGKEFFLIDTGGYVPDSADVFERAIREQVKISIDEANVILFLVDAKDGIIPIDEEMARLLRRSKKKVILTVNKVDSEKQEPSVGQFYQLGLGDPVPVSALIGRLSGDLLDLVVEGFPDQREEEDNESMHLAIIGRPNVGKSSFVNALLGTERAIVTDIPGTTRDALHTPLQYHGRTITLVDTAGLRRKSRVKENIEFYSTLRTLRSIQMCDVALCMIDAAEGLSHQDIDVISEAVEQRKGVVIAVNKWDQMEKDSNTAKRFEEEIHSRIKMYDYLPVVTVSALTKQRIHKTLDLCLAVHEQRRRRVTTSELNDAMLDILHATPPPSTPTGKEIKIRYVTQVRTAPPVIVIFCSFPKHIPESYRRFVERSIRRRFGFEGVPLTVQFRTTKSAPTQ
jgi:GTPase